MNIDKNLQEALKRLIDFNNGKLMDKRIINESICFIENSETNDSIFVDNREYTNMNIRVIVSDANEKLNHL